MKTQENKYRNSLDKDVPKMGTTLFLGNVTSLSKHAMDYLFIKQQNTDIWSIVETSMIPKTSFRIKQKFGFNNRVIYSNPGVPSPLGGKAHGGELHAVKKHFNSMPIDQQVLDNIAGQTTSTFRFSAMMHASAWSVCSVTV